MTALRFYINNDGAHEWYDLRHYLSIVPACLQCGVSRLVPFCFGYETTGAIIDDVIIEYLDAHELVIDAIGASVMTDGIYDWIIYSGTEVQSGGGDLDTGLARIRIEMSDGDEFYSDYFQICDMDISISDERLVYDDHFNIYFSAICDFNEPYLIIYQGGYENHHAFNTLPVRPDSNYVSGGDVHESQKEYKEYQSRKKNYQVEIIGGESLFDMMSILPLHHYVYVCWQGEDIQRAHNIEFEYDWIGDYLCRMIIHFSIINVKKGTCSLDFDI